MKTAIILGSARKQGNTQALVQSIAPLWQAEVFDLSDYDISVYDYAHNNRHDDFLPLIEHLLHFEHWVFASPLYWYTVSAQMKIFLDRLSDLLTIEKTLGRALRGKFASVLSTGEAPTLDDCFGDMMIKTFDYLGFSYLSTLYCHCPERFSLHDHQEVVASFSKLVLVKYNKSFSHAS